MRWIWWFCLPLAFKVCPQTLAQRPCLDSPTQVQARTRHTHFLPPPFSLSSSITSVCSFTHKRGVGMVISAHIGGGACEFIKQFECDYVNELCLIHATVWTSGVHAGCDKLHSLTAVYVCGLWLLNHLIVWEWLHWNSSHGPPKVTECFIKLEEMRGGMCTF